MNDGSASSTPAKHERIGTAPFFYGWVLVAIGFVTMAVGVNARTAFSLLFPAMLDEFGWDRGLTAGAFSFGFLVSAVVTPFVGRLMDQRGPRLVVELGVAAMGIGLLLGSLVREPWQLYLTLGALAGGGVNCLAYTGQSLYLTNWFVRRRGLALSIAFSGVGIGSITILPWFGWVLGLVSLVAVPGQIAFGHLSDRIGREWVWTIGNLGFVVCCLALIGLHAMPSPALLYVMIVAQGTLGYSLTSVMGAIPAEIFEGRHYGSIFGTVMLAAILGGAAGPWIAGILYDWVGSYSPAFWIAAACSVISMVAIWLAAPGRVRAVAGRTRKLAAD